MATMQPLPNTKKIMRFNIFLIALATLLCGCGGAGFRSWRYDSEHPQNKESVKKIICINPIYTSEKGRKKSAAQAVEKFEVRNSRFQELLLDNAIKARINLQLIDGNHLKSSDQDYFNDLAPLLNQMLVAINLQDGRSLGAGYYRDWEAAPMIDSRFSHLSKKYGTPYFMFTSLRKKSGGYVHTSWQAIIVNVESATIRHAEFRISGLRIRQDLLDSMIYDFFNILHRADS
jgi:hypothetical protein